MKPAAKTTVLPNGLTLAIRARLGTIHYRFFDGDRDFDGSVYWVERLRGVEFEPAERFTVISAANDATHEQGREPK